MSELSGKHLDEKNLLIVPRFPQMGNWIGVFLFLGIALTCGHFGFLKTALILMGLGILSLLTPVQFWIFDKSLGQLRRKLRNGLFIFRDINGYSLREINAVILEVIPDNEGGNRYFVRLVLNESETIIVSDQKRDADRIAAFLNIEKTTKNRG
jgi:hypothetical protein